MITLEAEKQIADDSPDHICPVGAIRDNFTSPGLIDEVKDGFDNDQISMLDWDVLVVSSLLTLSIEVILVLVWREAATLCLV